MEKAILRKIKSSGSKILDSGSYQRGFKESLSTTNNLARVMNLMFNNKHKSIRGSLLLIDLQKAYDSVNRRKLFEILRKRAVSDLDFEIIKRIQTLHKDSQL